MSHEAQPAEDYDGAVRALLSPLHQAKSPDELRAAAARRTNTLQDIQTYLHRIGLDVNSNDNQSNGVPRLIFHLTGTKGKGSTLAFCESILRNGYNLNTGMFTSPHLVCIRERIRINGLPVSKETFAKVYWTVRKKLECFSDESLDHVNSSNDDLPPLPKLPGYFRMLFLMAMYTFCCCESPKLDAILLEVGMGGRYDCTNVFEPFIIPNTTQSTDQPKRILMRGVTLIDYDHMRVLGSTLEQIAWEKGGIYCSNKLSNIGRHDGGYVAFLKDYNKLIEADKEQNGASETTPSSRYQTTVFASGNNTAEVLDVLRYIINRDPQQGQLKVVQDSCLDLYPEIGLRGKHQRSNAALALTMCNYAMQEHLSCSPLSREKLQHTLSQTFWPGRCHTVSFHNVTNKLAGVNASINLRCDGAHTPISIDACIEWFQSVASDAKTMQKVLIFNCSHERNPLPLLYSLYQSKLFDSVYFCRADFERPSMLTKKLEEQWYMQDIATSNNSSTCDDEITLKDMCNEMKFVNLNASTWQETLANVWQLFSSYDRQHLNTNCVQLQKVLFGLDVKSALKKISEDFSALQLEKKEAQTNCCIEVCVTGSLYIVGSALEAAGWEEDAMDCRLIKK